MVLPAVLRDPAFDPEQARRRDGDVRGDHRAGLPAVARQRQGTRSSKYRPLAKQFFWIFVVVCLGLGWLGAKPAESTSPIS
jgi:hypothetical protein